MEEVVEIIPYANLFVAALDRTTQQPCLEPNGLGLVQDFHVPDYPQKILRGMYLNLEGCCEGGP